MEAATVEEKFGKVWTAITENKGNIKAVSEKVSGNGIPGHEQRIGGLEEKWNHREIDCPAIKIMNDHNGRRQVAWDRIFLIFSSLIQSGLLVYFFSGGSIPS